MNNYIFVSNESLETITSFYLKHLNTKKENFYIIQNNVKQIDVLKLKNHKQIIFLLDNNDNDLQHLDVLKKIENLNELNIKSTIITSKINDNILNQFSKINATILMSE